MKNVIKISGKILSIVLLCSLALLPGLVQAQNISLQDLMDRARANGVEQAQLQELQARARGRGLSEQQLIEIIEPAVSLAENNLPSDMIIQKALEGLSKGVPADRMLPVLQNMRTAAQQASPLIDSWVQRPGVRQMVGKPGSGMPVQQFRREMIKATSRGLLKDIPSEELSNLLKDISEADIASKIDPSTAVAAVGVFSELTATIEQPEVSRSFIVRSLKGGFETAELQRLPAAMKVAQQRSQLPAASVVEGVARQMNGGIPARQILQNLFNGNIGGGPPGGTPPGLENKQNRGNSG